MRFLTVTPNPAIDTTYLLDRLAPGEINRVARVLPQPGGKGNNVARVLAALGHSPVATGFAGGHSGKMLEAGLRAQGVRPAFVAGPGETRVCLTIVEGESGRTTEIREPGATVTGDDATRLLDTVARLATEVDVVVLSGSLPLGLPPEFSARLITAARAAGAFVAFDAGGDALRRGLHGQPDLIKPNRDELTDLIGPTADDNAAIAAVQSTLLGPILAPDAAVLLSLGPRGAVLIGRDRAYRATPPPITPKNTVGCGDALLAGFLDARARGTDHPDALALAVAVGTAAALQDAVGAVDTADVARMRSRVYVTDHLVAAPEQPCQSDSPIHPPETMAAREHEGARS